MPSAYPGNPTPATLTAINSGVWKATQAYSQGIFVIPFTAAGQGQYFVCAVGGTTGSFEPNWYGGSGQSLPVPGTLFIDGSVSWICMGSYVQGGSTNPIITLPVDTDPPNAFSVARALATLADWSAIAVKNNTVPLTAGQWIQLGAWNLGGTPNNIYGRLWATIDYTGTTLVALAFTINAKWNGTQWQYDTDSTSPGQRFVFAGTGLFNDTYPASSASPWAEGAWVNSFANELFPSTGLGISGPVFKVAGATTVGSYGVPTIINQQKATLSTGTLSTGSIVTTLGNIYRVTLFATQALTWGVNFTDSGGTTHNPSGTLTAYQSTSLTVYHKLGGVLGAALSASIIGGAAADQVITIEAL